MTNNLASVVPNKGKRRTYRRGKGSGVTPYPNCRKDSARTDQSSSEPFKIQGVFFFDPESSTPDQFRNFLWDGLRYLAKVADARGWSAEKKAQLLSKAFDCLHKGSTDWWARLKHLATEDGNGPQDARDVYMAQPESLEAFEENKPTPIEYDYQPDYEFASPDEAQ